MNAIEGMIAATLTPYGQDGRVDHAVVATHVDYLADAGLPAIAPVGTTGEFLYLSEGERAAIVETAVRAAAGRLKVIAGIWALNAAGVARLAGAAERAGADALFLTTPIYYPATDEAVIQWYRAARSASRLPLFAYSIPQYAVNTVSPEALRTLLDEGTVDGIKDSSGNADRLAALQGVCAQRAAVYGASDSFTLKARRMGASGFISALTNIYPRTCLQIWSGDPAEAEEAQRLIDRVRTAVKGYGGIGGLKALLRTKGFDFGGTRLPFAVLSAEDERELLVAVEQLGVLD